MAAKTIKRDEAFIKNRIAIDSNGCWIWQRSMTWDGYGQVSGLGEARAHRLSWRIFKGLIPAYSVICHTCDNRACVNPDHLFVGSHSDNRRDAINKGRIDVHALSKHANSFHIIPETTVKAVIDYHRNNGGTQAEIGKLFGISQASVGNILSRNQPQ